MKKFFILSITSLSIFFAKGQVNEIEKAEAFQLIVNNQTALQISEKEVNNVFIQSTYSNKSAGTRMVYLQQSYKSIPVYNQIQTLAFKNGTLVSVAGERIPNLERAINVANGLPAVTAEEAVASAIADRKLNPTQNPISLRSFNNGHKVEFGTLGVARENITAELMWFPSDLGKGNIKLGWQVYIIQNNSSDYWLVNVDALNKSILSIGNLTVYCNWDDPNHNTTHKHDKNLRSDLKTPFKLPWENLFVNKTYQKDLTINTSSSPNLVNSATYRIVPFPAESPIHPGGAHTLVTSPWNLSGAGNNATSLNWHSIGTINYDFTRGNNVWAQEDSNANNGTAPLQVVSSTPVDPLTFDFEPDYTVDPRQSSPVPNRQFNTVNLFYWNNIIHDLTYQYGFDEAARNFQGDNLGRGGNQNDFVFADAQDGNGTNNANFSTPPDGNSGRMQMYVWTAANPDRDGDVDNGIIVHEYAHGISNRLTGNGSSCLQNAEQMGEGWSDYYSLMYTQDWTTANLNTGFNSPRGIGTYAINQPITGVGIRSQRYCTNFAINNKVYAATIPSQVHSRGEIWCATLWDMTWGIINQVGSINPNLFNASGAGGNSIALKLVTEGLKLQPCSPGFISSRDAILQADLNLYGGAYRCTILEAFRKRGMGLGASQGSSASVTDQIPSFTNGGAALTLIQGGIISVPEGQNINYINRVSTDPCSAFTGYTLTDTLPTNVTYVSGGTYNASNRVVSFTVNQAAGTTVDYNFVVNINAGTYFAPVTILNEPVPATMPASWTPVTTVPAGGSLWTVSTLQSSSSPNAFFVDNEVISTDKRLELTNGLVMPSGVSSYPKLSFQHRYNTEDSWDGGVVEISTNGGTTWTDLGANMLTNPYNKVLGAGAGNNLANRSAYSGLIPSFINTTVNLSSFGGQTALIRFRFGSDDNTAGTGTPTGWFVDDVNITNTATVSMRSSLFNSTGVRVNTSDTATIILQGVTNPPIISSPPSSTTVCSGATATFTATATGATSLAWEQSTNGGVSYTAVTPAATTTTLTLSGVTTAMNNNRYRLVATNGAGSIASTAGILTVNAAPSAPTTSSTSISYCQGGTATQLSAAGSNLFWYTTATGGSGNATAPTPNTATAGVTTFYVSQTSGSCESPRLAITVTVTATPAAPTVSSPVNYCQNTTAMPLTATGNNLLWYTTATGGTGVTTAPTPNTATIGTTTYYVSQSTGTCEGPRASIVVNVSSVTAAPTVISPVTYCQGATAMPLTATGTGLMWYLASTGGTGSATAPTPSTTSVGSTTFYVTQTSNCGESPRASIVVNVNATPAAPTVSSPVTYCQGVTATALTAGGTNLLWYTTATGGTGSATAPTPLTATAGTTNYYVSQTTGTCEGPRALLAIIVTAAPASPTVSSPVNYCQNAITTPLTATGTNLLWYTTATGGAGTTLAPTPSSTTLGNTTYYVSQSTGSCQSARAAITVTITAIPTAPIVTSSVIYCQNATATALSANGSNLLWYTSATGGSGVTAAPIPSTTTAGITIFYVSQTVVCESPRAAIVVTVNAIPAAPIVTSMVNYCQGGTATALTATGSNLLWYTVATGGTGSATAPTPSTATVGTTSYFVSQSILGCEGSRATITVSVSAGPAITVQPIDIISCATTATFNVTATGTNPTYQWQVSVDGGLSYSNIPNATSSSYTATGLTLAQSNNKYRVVVSAPGCSSAISNAATVRVGTTPSVVLTAAPTLNFNPSTNGGLYITVSPVGNYTYQWKRNSVILSQVVGTSITRANGLLDEFGTYQVIVTDVATGCSGISNTVTVSDITGERNKLFISPNPTQGRVRVSYYSNTTAAQARVISLYDSKGARIFSKSFNVVGTYGFMDVDLTNFVTGTYMIILRDAVGNKIASEAVIKY